MARAGAQGLVCGLVLLAAVCWRGPVALAHRGCCRASGAAFVPSAPIGASPWGLAGRQGSTGFRRQQPNVLVMAAAKGVNGKQVQQKKGLFGKKAGGDKTVTKKKVVKAKNTKTAVQKQQAAGRNARYQRQSLQRDDSWDLVEKQPIPVSSLLVGGGVLAAVSGYFGQKWWVKRHSKLITQFVDEMMDAGTDKRELAKTVVTYKNKLGPWSTPRLLQEYLKVVFRAPDLSPAFVEALDYVVTSLLRVKDDELFTYIAEVTKEMVRSQEYVGLSILQFVFERILPEDVASKRLEPLRRIVVKVFPGDMGDHMFELAKDAYTLEVESYFQRMEFPLVAPAGYEVLGLREKDAEEIFKKVKAEYQPVSAGGGLGGDLSQSLAVRKRDPMHDQLYGRVEDICDEHVSGYKDNKQKKAEDAKRDRPPTWDETVSRISRIVLTKEGESVISNLQRFSCMRCGRVSTLLPGQAEEEVFDRDYECPSCGSGRDMITRTS